MLLLDGWWECFFFFFYGWKRQLYSSVVWSVCSCCQDGIRRGRPRAETVRELISEGETSSSRIRCNICNRVFPREKSLQAHKRTHTGEISFYNHSFHFIITPFTPTVILQRQGVLFTFLKLYMSVSRREALSVWLPKLWESIRPEWSAEDPPAAAHWRETLCLLRER